MWEKINRIVKSQVILSAFLFVAIFVSIYAIFPILTAESKQQVSELSPGYIAVFSMWQLIMSAMVVWVMRKTDVFNIRDFRFQGLVKGLLLAWYCILLSIITFLVQFMQLPENSVITPNMYHVSAVVLHTLCIGVFEETLLRGLALKLLLKKMGNSKRGVIVACIVSSAFFGVAHITNIITGDSILQVASQIVSTTALGLYFAALYIRTRTLWVPIFVHMLVNLSTYIIIPIVSNDVLEQAAQAPANIAGNIINRVFLTVVFSVAGLILLRKANPNEVAGEKQQIGV